MQTRVGVCGEGGNSTEVNLSPHIPNRNFLLHTSHYSINHRKRTCSGFGVFVNLKFPQSSYHTYLYHQEPSTLLQEPPSHWRWERAVHPQTPALDYEQEQDHDADVVGVQQLFLQLLCEHKMSLEEDCALCLQQHKDAEVTLLPNSPQGLYIQILLLSYSPFGQDQCKGGRKGW